nr:hypothetical protein [Tanacetum cinerariifolium]
MHKAFPLPVIEFPLEEEVPTASEESCHCQKKKEATAVKTALLLKSRRNCQSKSDDSYAKSPLAIIEGIQSSNHHTSLVYLALRFIVIPVQICALPKTTVGMEKLTLQVFPLPALKFLLLVSISLDTAYAYIASQSNGSQIKYEDINQIEEDDIEEMDIKWNMALLSMRADRYWKKTWKKISI